MAAVNVEGLQTELLKRLQDVCPLPDEPDFFTSSNTLSRYLKARDYDLNATEKLLRETVEWRRKHRPLTVDCRWCHERPGFHCMRQVGFDEIGRPVVYSCFAQAAARTSTPEDALDHVIYLIENAKLTMAPAIHGWVFIIDCTGMSLPMCSPKLGYSLSQTMSNHYPERLGMVICIHHSAVFQGVWKAISVFLHPNTLAKVHLLRSKKKFRAAFQKHFSDELVTWLMDEISLNKQRPLAKSQRHFWESPSGDVKHDPRGCPSYVSQYIDTYSVRAAESRGVYYHKPHPNIIDTLNGQLKDVKPVTPTPDREDGTLAGANSNESLSESDDDGTPIAEQYQIPKGASLLSM